MFKVNKLNGDMLKVNKFKQTSLRLTGLNKQV